MALMTPSALARPMRPAASLTEIESDALTELVDVDVSRAAGMPMPADPVAILP